MMTPEYLGCVGSHGDVDVRVAADLLLGDDDLGRQGVLKYKECKRKPQCLKWDGQLQISS